MTLPDAIAEQGFTLQDVQLDDYGVYYTIAKECYEKYVDEFFGGWVYNTQIKMNSDAFNIHMKSTCFKKILCGGESVGFFAYNELDDKIDGITIQMLEPTRNKGIGSFYLEHVTALSNSTNKPVFLKVFKSNPAQNLYKRFGFEVYDETVSHYLMRYTPLVC